MDLNFIGIEKCGKYNFLMGDTEELYHHNLKKLPKDWYWREHGSEVVYDINKQGLRMNKDFDDIDLDNYCISIGCSFAFGQGMPFEEIYSYKIAKKYNLDLVLLANPGHGIDTFFHNFFLFLLKYEKFPKFVILSHTTPERKTYWYNNSYVIHTPEFSGKIRKKSYKEFLEYEGNYFFDLQLKRNIMINFLKNNNIPYLEFSAFAKIPFYENFLKIPNIPITIVKPLARDHQYYNGVLATHPGFDYQESVINYFNNTVGKIL